jgi:hypothetical protein
MMSCLSTCSDSRKRISLCSRRIRGIRHSAFKRKAAFTPLRLAEAIVRSHANETATTTGSGSARTRSITTFAFELRHSISTFGIRFVWEIHLVMRLALIELSAPVPSAAVIIVNDEFATVCSPLRDPGR